MPQKLAVPKVLLHSSAADWRWVDYIYCKSVTKMAGIQSARQYRAWVRNFKPGGIPSRPELVYPEWKGWGAFLDTNNEYYGTSPRSVREKDLMPYWDAVNLIQAMQLNTRDEYFQAFDDGLIPKGIPREPGMRYPCFYEYGGYKTFLGTILSKRIEAKKNIQEIFILYANNPQTPNILSILIHKTGVATLMNLIRDKQLNVIKIYNWYPDFGNHVFDLLNTFGKKQNDTSWLFNNINEILYELDSVLEVFFIKKH